MWEDMTNEEQSAMSDCLDIFYKWAKRGSIMGQIKEKYNTSRWYAYLGTEITLNTLFYPRYMFNQMPKWTYKFDRYIFRPVVNFLFLNIFTKWQVYCYQQAYKECFAKYPQYNFHCIDHGELVDKYIPVTMWESKLQRLVDSKKRTILEVLSELREVKDDNEKLTKTLNEWESIYK